MLSYVGRVSPPTMPVPPEGALYWDYVNGALYGSTPGSGAWAFIAGSAGPGAVPSTPIIQARLQMVGVTVPTTLSYTPMSTQMFDVSLYLKSTGVGIGGSTYTVTITYTAADGSGVQTISVVLHLDSANVIMETYPLMVLGGTTISTSGVYSAGAAGTPYSISERIVQMP